MVTFWGLRLALHLIRRIAAEPEDGRYQQLRREWAGKNVNLRFLCFFEFQALLDVLLSLPMLLAALNPAPELSLLEYAGVALWLVAVIGESVADAQLTAFKRNPDNRGRVCQWDYGGIRGIPTISSSGSSGWRGWCMRWPLPGGGCRLCAQH